MKKQKIIYGRPKVDKHKAKSSYSVSLNLKEVKYLKDKYKTLTAAILTLVQEEEQL